MQLYQTALQHQRVKLGLGADKIKIIYVHGGLPRENNFGGIQEDNRRGSGLPQERQQGFRGALFPEKLCDKLRILKLLINIYFLRDILPLGIIAQQEIPPHCRGVVLVTDKEIFLVNALDYLKNGSKASVEQLTAEMERAAENLEFEKAARASSTACLTVYPPVNGPI